MHPTVSGEHQLCDPPQTGSSFLRFRRQMGMDKMMFQKQHRMVSLAFIAYAIALVLGETFRAHVFPASSRKCKLFSVLFVFLKLKLSLSYPEFTRISCLALLSFSPLSSLSKLLSELQKFLVELRWEMTYNFVQDRRYYSRNAV